MGPSSQIWTFIPEGKAQASVAMDFGPLQLSDIVERRIPPAAWAEGENIPWDDLEFSKRMLAEHLSQSHDLASRRVETIDRQVEWIHQDVLRGVPVRILDLACGPGLYTSRLATLGYACVGIDFAPAAVRHAEKEAAREGLDCTYVQADVRKAEYGDGYGLAMMLFGQLNVFRRGDARSILGKALAALRPGGHLLLEPQRFETVERGGRAGSSWYSCGAGGGLFSERPHLCLSESFWDPIERQATERFYILGAETSTVTRHAITNEAYTDEEFRRLFAEIGFTDIRLYPSLTGVHVEDESQSANLAVVGRKPPSQT